MAGGGDKMRGSGEDQILKNLESQLRIWISSQGCEDLSGLTLQRGRELRCGLQAQLGSRVAVALAWASGSFIICN